MHYYLRRRISNERPRAEGATPKLPSSHRRAGGRQPSTLRLLEGRGPKLGLDPTNPEHEERGIALAEYAQRAGLITIEVDEGNIYRITAEGIDEVEGNKAQATSGTTFQFYGAVQGSVIGTHNTAELTNTFDFRAIEQRIEEVAKSPITRVGRG
jgi:hypothetical protein